MTDENFDRVCGCAIGIVVLLCVLLFSLIFGSCTKTEYIETVRIDSLVRNDTVLVVDSQVVVHNNVEYRDREIVKEITNNYIQGQYDELRKAIVDTLWKVEYIYEKESLSTAKIDSILNSHNLTEKSNVDATHLDSEKEKVVEKESTPWYNKVFQFLGTIFALLLFILAVGFATYKFVIWMKSKDKG